jgi:hypothetical protein
MRSDIFQTIASNRSARWTRGAGAVANAELRQVLPEPDSITVGELDRTDLSVAANGRK